MVIKGQWTSECTSCGNWQPELISSPDLPIVTAKASSNWIAHVLMFHWRMHLWACSFVSHIFWAVCASASSTKTLCSRGWEQLCSGEGKRKGKVRGRLRGRGGCEERWKREDGKAKKNGVRKWETEEETVKGAGTRCGVSAPECYNMTLTSLCNQTGLAFGSQQTPGALTII